MASRPSKRQKRPIVTSSDDEDSEVRQQPSKSNGKSEELKFKSARDRNDSNRTIPPRSRAKTRSTTLKSSLPLSTQTSTQPSQTHSLKKPARKRARSQKADLSGGKIEEEDFIEDDSLDEEFGKLLASQSTTRSVLDRRKSNSAPSQTLAAPAYQESTPCGSQKFIIPGKALMRKSPKQPLDDDIDSKPWAERYGPITLEEVMVHKKKVADVRTWLENSIQNRGHKVASLESFCRSRC